jgi:hypothetical protein
LYATDQPFRKKDRFRPRHGVDQLIGPIR